MLFEVLTSHLARGGCTGHGPRRGQAECVPPQDTAPSGRTQPELKDTAGEKVDVILSVSITFRKFSSGQ